MFKKKRNIEFLIKYAQGEVSTEDFLVELNRNDELKKMLVKNKRRLHYFKIIDYPNYVYKRADINSIFSRYEIYTTVTNFLITNKIYFKPYNEDLKLINIYNKIQPIWLDIKDEKYLENLWKNAIGKNKSEKIKWCKDKILSVYKYKKTPPKWLQNPEWPLDKNYAPLEFIEQIKDKDDPSKINYYFKDSQNNIVKIEQYD